MPEIGQYIPFPMAILPLPRNLPFTICLACDLTEWGRLLFHEFANSATVFSSGNNVLNHIRASGDQLVISGYPINSYHFQTSEVTTSFWKPNYLSLRSYISFGCYPLSWPSSLLTMMAAGFKHSSKDSKLPTPLKGHIEGSIILRHWRQHSGLLYRHYCNSFILRINC
jgi:hypothetical protein